MHSRLKPSSPIIRNRHLARGLVFDLPLSERGGTTVRATTRQTGTLTSATWGTGRLGPELVCGGSGARAAVTDGGAFQFGLASFTVVMGFQSSTANRAVCGRFGSSRGWAMFLGTGGNSGWVAYGAGSNVDPYPTGVGVNICDGAPHVLAAVYARSGNSLTLSTYVDGKLQGATTNGGVGDMTSVATEVQVGTYQGLSGSMVGRVPLFRLYTGALSPWRVRLDAYDPWALYRSSARETLAGAVQAYSSFFFRQFILSRGRA